MTSAWHRVRLGASLAGLAVALYLSALHYSSAIPLACSSSGTVNCERVLTSPYAVVGGFPVALWGAVWFAVAAALSVLPPASRAPWLRHLDLGWVTVGAAAVLCFIYVEIVVIGSICLWCTVVHALVIGIFAIAVLTPAG